jgi:fructuronate reductase
VSTEPTPPRLRATTALPRLSAATAPPSPGGRVRPPAQGIVHLGLGNFHRAHQAVYTEAALAREDGDWGILGVASRSAAVAEALRAQDLRYTVAEISPDGTRYTVPSVHTDAIVAARDPERVVAAIADPATRIVSLTVTENGYTYHPATKGLNLDHPDVRHDLAGGAPRSTIGQIVRGLQRRLHTHGSPVTVLSCDNLNTNGEHTRRLVLEFAEHLPRGGDDNLTSWIAASVAFPTTMVDRIVPATTDRHRLEVARDMGYEDQVPVVAEPFSMWILEDHFVAGRPAWEAGGAVFSDQVDRYEQLKVRLLNGTHSLIAYLGALSGAATIPEAVSLSFVEAAARQVLRREYLPSVEVPDGVDPAAYEEQLFVRWRNSALGHRTRQVGSDGSVKLRERIPHPALRFRAEGRMPDLLALTTAAYLSCLAPLDGFDPGPHAREMQDQARQWLTVLAAEAASGVDLARRALADRRLLGDDVAGWDAFIARTGELVDVIRRHGPEAGAADAMGGAR